MCIPCQRISKSIAPIFDKAQSYAVGDAITLNGIRLVAKVPIPAGNDYDATQWEFKSVEEELGSGGGGSSVIPIIACTLPSGATTLGVPFANAVQMTVSSATLTALSSGTAACLLPTPSDANKAVGCFYRFDGTALAADKQIQFSTASGVSVVHFDSNGGKIKAGKVLLGYIAWNGTGWDASWKVSV